MPRKNILIAEASFAATTLWAEVVPIKYWDGLRPPPGYPPLSVVRYLLSLAFAGWRQRERNHKASDFVRQAFGLTFFIFLSHQRRFDF